MVEKILMVKYLIVFFFLAMFSGCNNESDKRDEVAVEENVVRVDVAGFANHIIIFTDGYANDTLVVEINDSPYFNGVLNTDESIGVARIISVYDSVIKKIELKSTNANSITVESVYKPALNHKWMLISKDSNTFNFYEREEAPRFR